MTPNILCSRCSTELPTGARFCPACGRAAREGWQGKLEEAAARGGHVSDFLTTVVRGARFVLERTRGAFGPERRAGRAARAAAAEAGQRLRSASSSTAQRARAASGAVSGAAERAGDAGVRAVRNVSAWIDDLLSESFRACALASFYLLGLALLVVIGSDAATWYRPAVEGFRGTPDPWMPDALAEVVASKNYGWVLLGTRVATIGVLVASLARPHRLRWLTVLVLGSWMGFAESTQTGLAYWVSCPRLIMVLVVVLSAGWVAPGQRRDRRVTFVQLLLQGAVLVACRLALAMEEPLPWDRGAFVRPADEVIEIFVGLGTVLMTAAILSGRPYGLLVARNLTVVQGAVWCFHVRQDSLDLGGTGSPDVIWRALILYGFAVTVCHLLYRASVRPAPDVD